MLRRLVWAFLLATFGVAPVSADLIYDFKYEAKNGPIRSFHFSLTSETFIRSANESPVFKPFEIGDGVNSWTLTQDVTSFSPPTTGDICFATTGTLLESSGGGCVASYHPPNGLLEITFINGLPSQRGEFFSNFGGDFYLPDGQHKEDFNLGTGTLELKITGTPGPSDVPEPSSVLLVLPISLLSGLTSLRNRRLPNR